MVGYDAGVARESGFNSLPLHPASAGIWWTFKLIRYSGWEQSQPFLLADLSNSHEHANMPSIASEVSSSSPGITAFIPGHIFIYCNFTVSGVYQTRPNIRFRRMHGICILDFDGNVSIGCATGCT